jgi:hypothetical protein
MERLVFKRVRGLNRKIPLTMSWRGGALEPHVKRFVREMQKIVQRANHAQDAQPPACTAN